MTQTLKVFGPPGTGKTTRLLSIMERELESGVPPERLAYLTFTVAARHEAKTRAAMRFGFTQAQLKWFRTLHSTAHELLGVQRGVLVTDRDGLPEFGQHLGYTFTGGSVSEEGLPVFGSSDGDRLLAFDHLRRHHELSVDEAYRRWDHLLQRNKGAHGYAGNVMTLQEVRRFCDGYERWKADDGRLDFTDLLARGAAILDCDVVIVDEAQDLSPLQWRCFWRFAASAARVYVAGDDDQAIYEWAGASPAAFLAQPGEVEVLPRSYRCPPEVTDLAQRIISRVRRRQPKSWLPREDAVPGRVIWTDDYDRIDVRPDGSTLILYRNHYIASDAIRHLRALGEPYVHRGASSISHDVANAIVTWEKLRRGDVEVGQDDLEHVLGASSQHRFSMEQRGRARALEGKITGNRLVMEAFWPVGPLQHPWFTILDRLREDEYYIRKVVQRGGVAALTGTPRVRLSTIHGAKGAEADHVVLHTGMTRMTRREIERDPDPERRVWYVGVTRARRSLTMIGSDNPLV